MTQYLIIPSTCPICGGATAIQKDNESEVLICTEPTCHGKLLGRLVHFCSRKAMNIEGLSEATLDLLISNNYINKFKDIYALHTHKNELAKLPGLGLKSVEKLLESIEKSRECKLENFIAALVIPNIGLSAAKTISNYFNGHYTMFIESVAAEFNFTKIDDFGTTMNNSIYDYMQENFSMVEELAKEIKFLTFEKKQVTENPFVGKILVITGKLTNFTRDSINEKIASLGAKTSGSVSKNTDYLITNEASGSSKYKKATELGVPVITEAEFLKMIEE